MQNNTTQCNEGNTIERHRFGSNVEYVHCINMMPFTPITEELLRYDFMEQEWPVLRTAFDGRDPGEKTLL